MKECSLESETAAPGVESIGRATYVTGYSEWRGDGCRIAVRESVMQAIGGRASGGHGLLLGSLGLGGGFSIVVEAAEPLDGGTRANQIAAAKAEGLKIVGAYKRQTRAEAIRPEPELTGEDLALRAEAIQGDGIFLVVRPIGSSRTLVDLWAQRRGRLDRELEMAPFPFETTEPPRVEDKKQARAAGTKLMNWLWFFLFAILGGLTGYATVSYFGPNGAWARSRTEDLGLTAQRSGDRWVLQWNGALPALSEAQAGEVTITDGTHTWRYSLDRQQVRSGSMAYQPKTSQVEFLVEMRNSTGRTIRGSLIVVDPGIEELRSSRTRSYVRSSVMAAHAGRTDAAGEGNRHYRCRV